MITWSEILIRLSLAALFGGMVGIERERKDWAAGLRTHMMVCVGSSLAMIVSAFGFADILGTPNVSLDPSRIAGQVISGIGFLGAGTILFLRQEVIRGLTTAAGLWTVSAIGLATGGGMYFAAVVATIIVIIILWALQPVEKKVFRRYKNHTIKLKTAGGEDKNLLAVIKEILDEEKVELIDLSVAKQVDSLLITLRFTNIGTIAKIISIVNNLEHLPGVDEVYWSKMN